MDKLYIIVRRDLPNLGQMAVQGAHALTEYLNEH